MARTTRKPSSVPQTGTEDGDPPVGRKRLDRKLALLATTVLAAPLVSLGLYAASLPAIDPDLSASRSTIVVDREDRLLRAFTTESGHWRLPVTAGDVDPRYLAILKAFEDRRFDIHHGVDPAAMARAAGQAISNGRIVSGGSTLTMQVARLAEPRPERSLTDKLRQAVQAVKLDARLSKDAILGLYLSLAPFGGNIEGVRAASFAWFGKEPKRLSVAEAALLVALPQSPEARRPDRFPESARIARARVLDRALAEGVITAEEADAAKAEPVPVARKPFPMLAAHLAERVVAERPQERMHRLSIDARLQRDLEQLARERAAALGPKLSAAIVVVENATGEVRASVAGADYFAAERAGSVDLTRALRSPGSALKPFVYALAFDGGIAHPETMLEDRPMRYGAYAPENFDLSFQGMVTARTALQHSLNVPVVDLLSALGPQRFVSRLRAAGADLALPKDGGPPGLAVGLGGLGITLQDLTGLFVGLARGGETAPLSFRPRQVPPRGRASSRRRRPGMWRTSCGARRRRPTRRRIAGVENGHLLRLSRRLGRRLRPEAYDRRLAGTGRQRRGAGPRRPDRGGAASVRRLRAGGPRPDAVPTASGSARRRGRPAAPAAPASARRRAQDAGGHPAGAAARRLSARRRADRSRGHAG